MSDASNLTGDELKLVDFHCRANAQIFLTLKGGGFNFIKETDIDFHCVGNELMDVADLAGHFQKEYRYETSVHRRVGVENYYTVEGRRLNIILSQELMDKWCRNMVIVCGDFGCRFGGWGVRH